MSILLRVSMASLVLGGLTPAMAGSTFDWAAPPVPVQLYGDDSEIPQGFGAVFIPTLTSAEAEPDVLIVDEDEVKKAPTGHRIAVEPGAYVVLVGTGQPDERVGVEVVIKEGKTTVVPVRWGGLRIEVVNKRLRTRPNTYELVQVESGKTIQLPKDFREDGDEATTWLLEPGLYRIQEEGSSGVEAPVFSTVFVPEGALVNQRLFVDASGSIKGGGVIPPEAFQDHEVDASPWTSTLIVGVDGAGTQTKNLAGFPDLTVADGSAFVDLDVNYLNDLSAAYFGLDASYGMMLLQPSTGEPLPLIKSKDNLRAVAAYTLRLNEGVGFYVRGTGHTQMTDTFAIATQDSEIQFRELDGTVRVEQVQAPNTYKVSDGFKPLELQAGSGLEVRLSTFRNVEFSLRGGVGYRHLQYGGSYVSTDNTQTPAIEYSAVGDFSRPGFEAGLSAGVHLTGFANWSTTLDTFTAFDGEGGVFAVWDNTLSVRLTRAVSLNYSLNATRQPWVSNRIAIRQGAYARFALNVL